MLGLPERQRQCATRTIRPVVTGCRLFPARSATSAKRRTRRTGKANNTARGNARACLVACLDTLRRRPAFIAAGRSSFLPGRMRMQVTLQNTARARASGPLMGGRRRRMYPAPTAASRSTPPRRMPNCGSVPRPACMRIVALSFRRDTLLTKMLGFLFQPRSLAELAGRRRAARRAEVPQDRSRRLCREI